VSADADRHPGGHRPRWLVAVLATAATVAIVAGAAAGARAQPPPFAGIVVQMGDGTVHSFCLPLTGGRTTGEQLLRQTGLALAVDQTPLGAQVCQIQAEGCAWPAESCWCRCRLLSGDCRYWAYSTLEDGAWRYALLGASAREVAPGDVDGWAWGKGGLTGGVSPPVVAFETMCRAELAAARPGGAAQRATPGAAEARATTGGAEREATPGGAAREATPGGGGQAAWPAARRTSTTSAARTALGSASNVRPSGGTASLAGRPGAAGTAPATDVAAPLPAVRPTDDYVDALPGADLAGTAATPPVDGGASGGPASPRASMPASGRDAAGPLRATAGRTDATDRAADGATSRAPLPSDGRDAELPTAALLLFAVLAAGLLAGSAWLSRRR